MAGQKLVIEFFRVFLRARPGLILFVIRYYLLKEATPAAGCEINKHNKNSHGDYVNVQQRCKESTHIRLMVQVVIVSTYQK